MRRIALFLLAVSLIGCNSKPVPSPYTHFRLLPAPIDPWKLICVDFLAKPPAILWNGLIGIRIGRDGRGTGKQDFFDIQGYGKEGEEKIQAFPNPLDLKITVVKSPLKISVGKDYAQTLDMRTGILKTEYVSDTGVHVSSETALDPFNRRLSQQWSFSGRPGLSITIEAPDKAHLGKYTIHGPERTELILDRQGKGTYTLELGAKDALPRDKPPTHESVKGASVAAWEARWKTDIEIDGPVEDQQAVRSFLFYLRSATSPDGQMSISPFGLSNDKYGGHVFWDADIWVFPALMLIDPAAAKSIVQYRLDRKSAAEDNFEKWMADVRPIASGKLGPLAASRRGLKYPWESSVSGRETVPGPSKFEEHITGDVAFAAIQAASLGLVPEADARSIAYMSARYYVARSNVKGDHLEMPSVMSPDENHVGDNDLYTNALANWTGEFTDPQPLPFKLPRDDEGFLTYDNDALRTYKQAAAVLAIYPLQYPPAEKRARKMMDRFGDKTSKNGPAMSDSLHALIWARIGETDKAYQLWKSSWQDFTTQPHLQFAEKRNLKDTYFTTGAAGCLQTILFGFLGFRLDSKVQEGASWSVPLALNRILSVKPNLPAAWKSVKFKNFTVRGRRYTLIATHKGVQVIQGEP